MKRGGLATSLLLTAVLAAWGYSIVRDVPVVPVDAFLALVVFTLLLLPVLLFGAEEFTRRAARFEGPIGTFVFSAYLLAVWLLFVAGPGRFHPTAFLLLLYLFLPVACARLARERGEPPNLWDAAALVAIYLPVELAWIGPAWGTGRADLPSPEHPFTQLTAIGLALFCFLAVRPLPGIGYRFRLQAADVGRGLLAFAWFFPVAVLLGSWTGFVPFDPHLPDPGRIVGTVLGVTFLVALPEELFFRGLVQNLLERISPSPAGRRAGFLAAALLFGLSHLNNHPRFDWRYVGLATLAGIAYGQVYRKTGKVTAAAIPHALVDIVWRLVL